MNIEENLAQDDLVQDSSGAFGEEMDLLWQSPSSLQVKEERTIEILEKYGITAKRVATAQYAILNGCTKHILLQPTLRKCIFKESSRSFFIQARFDTLYELMLGYKAYKRLGE